MAGGASSSASSRRSSTEEQRAKNRLVVKRCYYRKLTTLQDLREQVTALEDQYARLLADHARLDATPSPATASTASTASSTSSTSSTAVHAAYVRLLQLRGALAHENRALQALEAQHAAAERSIAQLHRSQLKAAAAVAEAAAAKRATPPDLATFRPLSLATCLAVARAAYREVRSFRESRAQCASTGLSFMGWRDRRLLDQRTQTVRFSLEKVFEDIEADAVADRVWSVLSTPEGVARAYPRSVNARFQVLQHVSDDAVILYHSLEREDAPDVRIRALILAMRVKVAYLEDVGVVAPVDSDNDDIAMSDKDEDAADDAGPTLILYRGLDPKRFLRDGTDSEGEARKERRGRVKLEPQTEDVWMDTFVWGHFDRAGDQGQHCVDDFGGIIHGTALATAGWWMLEILGMALRIEAEAFGPQLRLCT